MKNLDELSIIELQALGYQNMVQIDALNNGLRAINNELAKRGAEVETLKAEKKEVNQ